MSVLIVEDEPRLGALLVRAFEQRGHSAVHVLSGSQALENALSSPPAVIILDLGLPDIDGLEILRRLRERESHVPVIILTARTDEDDRSAGLGLGAAYYVTKPFSFVDLFDKVRACTLPAG